MRLVGLALVVGATAVLVTAFGRVSSVSPPPASDGPSPQVDHTTDGEGSTGERWSLPAPAPAMSTPLTRACLEGDALARTWLTAFLTRADRNDVGWTLPVSLVSGRRLVDQLRAEGPGAVGLEEFERWQVVRIDRVRATDPALDTQTRHVLAYAATVTDGSRTTQKPFVLYSYLDPDGCWRVEDVEQPYSSEG